MLFSKLAENPRITCKEVISKNVIYFRAAVGINSVSHDSSVVLELPDFLLDLDDSWTVAVGTFGVFVGFAGLIKTGLPVKFLYGFGNLIDLFL